MSQDLPKGSSHRKPYPAVFVNNRASYLPTDHTTQTHSSFQSAVGGSQRASLASKFPLKANAKQLAQASGYVNERAQKRSKLEIESEMHDPERTFEVVVGGKTDASIFYDNTHARHEEEKEFDRIFGAVEGRKFRIGHSVEV